MVRFATDQFPTGQFNNFLKNMMMSHGTLVIHAPWRGLRYPQDQLFLGKAGYSDADVIQASLFRSDQAESQTTHWARKAATVDAKVSSACRGHGNSRPRNLAGRLWGT